MLSMADKKIINIFRSFIDKVFVPQLSKLDQASQQEWAKFSNMISVEQLNLVELQSYVDNIGGGSNHVKQNFQKIENKSPLFSKARKDSLSEQPVGGFNPSRTFGGQRARVMFPIKDFDEPQADRQNYNFSKDFSKEKQQNSGLTTQAVLPTLERLFKLFNDNQIKMERIGVTTMPNSYESRNYNS